MKSPDDDDLIRFLKEHEPCPLPPAASHETVLMAMIDAPEMQPKPRKIAKLIWLVPTAIAAGLGVVWSQYKPTSVPMPEVAEIAPEPLVSPTAALVSTGTTNDQELGAFLEDSWSNSFDGKLYRDDDSTYGYATLISSPAQ